MLHRIFPVSKEHLQVQEVIFRGQHGPTSAAREGQAGWTDRQGRRLSGQYLVWRQWTTRRGVSQLPPSLFSGPHKGQGPDTWAAVKRRRCKRTGRSLICIGSARPPIGTGGATARAPFGGGLAAPWPYGRWVLRPAGAGRRRALPGALAGLRALPVSGGGVRRAAERPSVRTERRPAGRAERRARRRRDAERGTRRRRTRRQVRAPWPREWGARTRRTPEPAPCSRSRFCRPSRGFPGMAWTGRAGGLGPAWEVERPALFSSVSLSAAAAARSPARGFCFPRSPQVRGAPCRSATPPSGRGGNLAFRSPASPADNGVLRRVRGAARWACRPGTALTCRSRAGSHRAGR